MSAIANLIDANGGFMVAGVLTGVVTGIAYFVGLALTIKRALSSSPIFVFLIVSAVVRIGALLFIGWLLATSVGLWAVLCYAATFVVVRQIAVRATRHRISARIP
jgi:hypothetical protein